MTGGGPWLSIPVPRPDAHLRLICLPHAGGNAAWYRGWAPYLPDGVELAVVRLPGREARISEPTHESMDTLVPALVAALAPAVSTGRYALYGHSMGAVVAFELCRALAEAGSPPPALLVVSGSPSPQVAAGRVDDVGRMSPDDFTHYLRRRGGTPPEFFAYPELVDLMVPALRADLTLLSRYRFRPGALPEVPIVAFGGTDDPDVRPAELAGWREHARDTFRAHLVDGGHFFVAGQAFLALLGAELAALSLPRAGR